MCGILGAIEGKRQKREHAIETALPTLKKRGPDGDGIMRFPAATLGQTRLSIVDIAGGIQPMRDNTQDIAVTFNGEIYNYKELREELERRGHRFSTNSDTEAILKAYLEYGDDCPRHLDGMFAFAIWDNRRQRLFMARDRFGKKPFFYTIVHGMFLFASEIKALLGTGLVHPILDMSAIDAYLALYYIPVWKSAYRDITPLMPAHSAVFEKGKMTTTRYWEMPRTPLRMSYDEALVETKRLFTESVRKRMIADVEIGALLSGGVDSTLTTAYAQQFTDHPIKTFALGYGDYINELPYAQQASTAIGTDHYTLQAHSELTAELEKTLAYFDEPHGDPADFPQHLVSELAASKVKVALAGDGGDELFLGYGTYFSYWHARKITRLKNFLLSNPYREHLRNATVFPASLRRSLWKDSSHLMHEPIDQLIRDIPGNGIEKMNLYDLTMYLPGQLLTKVDQMSMMHGLEVRCPFLDHHLAEFAFNLPEAYKTDRSTGKIILKDLLAEIMPRDFVDRKKQGFGAPVRKWLNDAHMKRYVESLFAEDAHVYAFLKADRVHAFIEHIYTHQNAKSYYQLWNLLCLEVWLRMHPSISTPQLYSNI